MGKSKKILGSSVSAFALFAVAGLAQAQDAPAQQVAQAAPQAGQPEEIVVSGYRHALEESLLTKRNADGVVEAINSEDIGKLPDKNVADALQRLPGIVTTQSAAAGAGGFGENDRVAIRGTAPALTSTLIDGHAVGTGDWFILDQLNQASRSVSFSMFPSPMVDSIEVFKSSEADLPEGGTAGTVDIKTHAPLDFPDLLTVEATGGASYNDLAGQAGPDANALIAWKNDDHTFGVEVMGFYEDRFFARDGQEILGYGTIPTTAPYPKALQGVLYPQIINDAYFTQERLRQGGQFAVEFRPDKTWDIKLDGFYSYLNAGNYNQGDLITPNNLIRNNVVPTAYTVSNGVLTSATFPVTNLGEPGVNDIYRPDASSSTYYLDFDTTWHPVSNLSLHAQVGYTRGRGSTDQWALGYTNINPSGLSYGLNGSNPATIGFPGGTGINNPANYLTTGGNGNQQWVGDDVFGQLDTEGYGQVDAEYALDDAGIIQSIKAGVRVTQHDRFEPESEVYAGVYSVPLPVAPISNGFFPSDFGSGAGFSAPFNISVDPVAMAAEIQAFQNKILGGAGATLPRYYWQAVFSLTEDTDSGYVMARIGGDKWSGNFGIRVSSTSEDITTFDNSPENPSIHPITTSLFGNYYENPHSQNYLDILPSLNLKYDLTPDLVVHASASRTMTRPNYYDLAGGLSLTDQTLTGSGGNPSLKPTRSTNFDLSTEWYYGKDSLLAFGLFDLELESTWDSNVVQETELNLSKTQSASNPLGLANPIYSLYNVAIPVNNSGQSKGFELAWTQPIWEGIGINMNYAYAQSSQNTPTPGLGGRELLGAAKHTGSATLYYENDWLDTHLSYTAHSQIYQGLDGRGDKYFQDDGGQLDGAVNFHVYDGLTLSVIVQNITDESSNYVNQRDLDLAAYDFGRTFFFTASYKFTIPEAPQPAAAPVVPAPAPVPPPAPAVEAKRSFQVFFDFDKSNITQAAASVIQAAADAVKAGHVVQITVTGHTDTVGTAAYNQGLSERRAAAVKQGLVTDGVPGGEITTVGVGKNGLLVPTADGVREPQNRRAEIVLQ